MDAIPQFVIAGIPLILIVFALVEEFKAWGLGGKILRAVALLLGLVLAFGYQVAVIGVPADPAAWFTAVVVGLVYGLTASGAYNFLNTRFPAKA